MKDGNSMAVSCLFWESKSGPPTVKAQVLARNAFLLLVIMTGELVSTWVFYTSLDAG
ncbi:hypothetical protein JYU34_006150 [Plutella xylostella]|uniref:Uncharacterized protein n=1 Tax=Plutella xylostella TaxID=51655 RepID=A0ABQ7QV32_PLUXY|nr:hypothetical protein JYU34_006150 [Plutella xylostella]